MKPIAILLLMLCCTNHNVHAQISNPLYDSLLAKKLNADDYGMKAYVLVILKTGPAPVPDKLRTDSIFKGHMKNIQDLAAQNKLIMAGPLGKNDKKYEGIFVLNTANIEEAKKMLDSDPAIHSNLLAAELYLWYSSAALQEVLEMHKKIEKKHF